MIRIWEVSFRQDYSTNQIFDREKVTARTAADALKKAKPYAVDGRHLVPTDVKLIAEAR